jgi:hypothetical protein
LEIRVFDARGHRLPLDGNEVIASFSQIATLLFAVEENAASIACSLSSLLITADPPP